MLDRARALAAERDLDDPAEGTTAAPLQLPDHRDLAAEDAAGIPFADILAADFDPAPPRDRIEHPWLAPAGLDSAAERLIDSLPVSIGRHNRYRPVPGEDALSTGDLLDFVAWYGHEYQVLVFRAADVRSASRLDISRLTEAGIAAGARVYWDWTGAVDWVRSAPPRSASAVFWSTHASLWDGRAIPSGWYRPAEETAPTTLSPDGLVGEDRVWRLAAFASTVVGEALEGTGASLLHPGPSEGLPLLVLEAGQRAQPLAAALAATSGFRSLVRYGGRVVALPDPASTYDAIVDCAAALSAAVRS
ncbi:hypothetical protein P0L94_12355 [Microbacter sp. GSS18]|nr:hypothetical protein P0L94_12355 [Microbacter sp. GSS18]